MESIRATMETILGVFRYLKAVKGVEDPNIDLFLAIGENSPEHVKVALDAGADPNITTDQILAKYRDHLKDF